MKERQHILRTHYFGLLKRATTWLGLIALVGVTFGASPTFAAAQATTRIATLSDSGAGDSSVSYDIKWTAATTTLIKSVRFQFCTSPLYNTACSLPSGLVRGGAISLQKGNGTTYANAYAYGTSGTTDLLFTNATGNTMTAAQTQEFTVTGFTNPSSAGEFYIRVITCNDTTCTVGAGTNIDEGGFAVDATQVLNVNAVVQEDLTFCVGVTVATPCSSVGAAAVPLTPNIMTTGGNSHGTAQMAASTNGQGGYSITLTGTNFTDATADTIAAAPSGGAVTNAGGTEQFGMVIGAQTSGNLNGDGTATSGTGSGAAVGPYNGVNSTIAYNPGVTTQVASASGPTAFNTYTMLYAANIATTTKPGAYVANQTYIATATF